VPRQQQVLRLQQVPRQQAPRQQEPQNPGLRRRELR
jgi:hypothetical protein